jgi:hypothetical protein
MLKTFTWFPIYLEPIPGSGERLVLAVAVGHEREGRLFVVDSFVNVLGRPMSPAIKARQPALATLKKAVQNKGVAWLSAGKRLTASLWVGTERKAEAADFDAAGSAALRIASTIHYVHSKRDKTSAPAQPAAAEVLQLELTRPPARTEKSRNDDYLRAALWGSEKCG